MRRAAAYEIILSKDQAMKDYKEVLEYRPKHKPAEEGKERCYSMPNNGRELTQLKSLVVGMDRKLD